MPTISSLVLYLCFVCKMAKEKKSLAKDRDNNIQPALIKTTRHHRSNLDEIRNWETENSAWVDSLSPE
jgi:hypothetical protein